MRESVSMHRNLLFDLDQTLLDFHASERLALEFVMEQKGLAFSQASFERFKGINKSLWLDHEKGLITKPQLFEQRFARLFGELGKKFSQDKLLMINDVFIYFMSHNGVLLDGAIELLEKIEVNIPDARIYIITNGVTRNALGRINSTGLGEHIEKVYVSEAVGFSKPAREFFDKVINDIGEPRESYLVIGDSLTSDMQGAKNASLTSCYVFPEGDIKAVKEEYDTDYTAASYDELYDVIINWIDKTNKGMR